MQGGGTAHSHAAVHVRDAPKLDVDQDIDFTTFADKYISCIIPDKETDPELFELVASRQCHHHTRTCKMKKGCSCRVPSDENANALNEFASDLEEHIVMKRKPSDIFVNNYNPTILRFFKSNMDIQIITPMWACIAYITSYICNTETTQSELMSKASKEVNDNNISDKLFSIVNILRKVYINRLKAKQNKNAKTTACNQDDRMIDHDEDIYVPGVQEKYAARPKSLEDLCLVDFVANYTHSKAENGINSEETEEVDPAQTSLLITLSGGLGKMSRRKKPQVIRYHFVSKENGEDQYYHRLLLLYLPWRIEKDKIKYDTYKELLKEK
ncbi:hypothetical protein MAR_021406 [Mya arenaria]|uniref:Uncharacterized protein n=1 Tax=Mya arenaria TaxID=6604 RepID=A0ABY7E7Q1_MYAAR|nr:hypothetical protein MAR_021406 [Mya arenaria]